MFINDYNDNDEESGWGKNNNEGIYVRKSQEIFSNDRVEIFGNILKW